MRSFLMMALMFTYLDASALGVQTDRTARNVMTDGPDCIEKVRQQDQRTSVRLRSGKTLDIRRDSLGRVEMIKIGAESFLAQYDPNFPDRFLGVRQSTDAKAVGGTDGLINIDTETLAQAIRHIPRSAVRPCAADDRKAMMALAKDTDPDNRADWLLSPEADLSGHEFGRIFWAGVHRPFYDDAFNYWMDYSPRQDCIDNATACVDVCDEVATKRSYACAVLTAVYFEVPVAAAVAGLACIMASDDEKNRCKRFCPPLSKCF